jgi:tRNA pseudouridine55 synthase
LYDLARQGLEVEREARSVRVDQFKVSNFRRVNSERLPNVALMAVDIEVHVSKGTYVRTLAADLGRRLGVGAHIDRLHRTSAGCFNEEHAVSIEQLERLKSEERFQEMDAKLLPITAALGHIPNIELDEQSSFYLRRGNPVQVPKAPLNGMVSVLSEKGEFLGVGEIDEQGLIAPKRLIAS